MRMAALAGVQVGVELKALVYLTPSEARLSRLGVLAISFRAQPRRSALIWSAIMKRMFGLWPPASALTAAWVQISNERSDVNFIVSER